MGTLLSSLSFAPAPAQTSKNEIARKHILSMPIYLQLRWRRTLELENLPASCTFTAEFPYLQGLDQGYNLQISISILAPASEVLNLKHQMSCAEMNVEKYYKRVPHLREQEEVAFDS